jgi:hypothetical protein
MYDVAIIWDWISFAVRWLHVITAMAWIGSSFYFIALDLGLNRNIEGSADGEEWQVHGGGILSHPEVSRRPRGDARASDLVQMGKLHHLAVWGCHVDGGLLGRIGTLYD